MRRIRGATTRRSMAGFLAAARKLEPTRHRRVREAPPVEEETIESQGGRAP